MRPEGGHPLQQRGYPPTLFSRLAGITHPEMFPLQWLAWNKLLEKAAPQRAFVLCGFLEAHSAKISVLPSCPASIVCPTASVAVVFLLLSIPSHSSSPGNEASSASPRYGDSRSAPPAESVPHPVDRQELFKAEEIQDVIVHCDLAAELQPRISVSLPKPRCPFSLVSFTPPHLLP